MIAEPTFVAASLADGPRPPTPADDAAGTVVPHSAAGLCKVAITIAILIALPLVGILVLFTMTPAAQLFFGRTALMTSGLGVYLFGGSIVWIFAFGAIDIRIARMMITTTVAAHRTRKAAAHTR